MVVERFVSEIPLCIMSCILNTEELSEVRFFPLGINLS
jgi:hypothetical protein